MEILDLRHFSSTDLRGLLEQETEVWLRLLAWDYRASAEMILRYVDAKILPGYAALDHGAVFGYSFFVYEGSKGVIGDLFVANGAGDATPSGGHGNPVERKLLTHVIETLQQSPGIHRIEAQLLVHEAGAVASPFMQEGFRRFPRLFMTKPLKSSAESGGEGAAEIEIRPWTEKDYQSSAAVITAAYRGHVDSEINDQYRSLNGSLRFLNNIVRFPGCGIFDAGASFAAVHSGMRSMVGLILCSRVKEDVGHVTQVCVLPEFRGKKIGEALVAATERRLHTQNFSLLSLTVTEANTGAVELYRKLGFSVNRVFDAFVWEG